MNFGTGREIEIKKLAELIIKFCNSKSKLKFSKKLRTGETPRLLCDSKDATKITKWKPKFDLETGLMETIKYFDKKKDLIENIPYML